MTQMEKKKKKNNNSDVIVKDNKNIPNLTNFCTSEAHPWSNITEITNPHYMVSQ